MHKKYYDASIFLFLTGLRDIGLDQQRVIIQSGVENKWANELET
jgi:hypothetical protein